MKAITVKYFGPTVTKGSRLKASDSDGNSVALPYRYEPDVNYAAIALCKKMKWTGTLHRGQQKPGVDVFVFEDSENTIQV